MKRLMLPIASEVRLRILGVNGWRAIHRTVGPLPGSRGQVLFLPSYLQAPVNNPVGLKVIVILSKWVDELLCHLEGK